VFLRGDLGAGKTTLVRGLLRALGYRGPVRSPTYTLIEPYEVGDTRIHHLDLYRLGDPEELEFLGIRDLLDGRGLLLVEWPERGGGILPNPELTVDIRFASPGRRLILLPCAAWAPLFQDRGEPAL
jgi:tRNA threonylcarbamoyladenosine biosynthesis protein TsaE